MRLALKLAAALMVGVGLVLALQALLHVHTIEALHEEEVRDDALTLGKTLAAATAEIWVASGRDRASEFVRKAAARRTSTQIRLLLEKQLDVLGKVPKKASVVTLARERPRRVLVEAPVRVEGRVVAVVRIDRKLPGDRAYLASILRTQVVTTVLAAFVSGLIALLVGWWLIGRPIRRLSKLAHSVADGDFARLSDVSQRDEIGGLAAELDAMAHRLAASHRKVRQERRARTDALEQLRHADRLSTVGKLASSMAHELGTPLNVISGRAMMIASDEQLPEFAQQNARIIAEQVTRMTTIIQDVLDFARRKPLERKKTRIGDVVEHAVNLLEPICDDRRVHIKVEGFQDAVARVDAGKTLQVLTNLMMNAIHAMPRGGNITLRVAEEHVSEPRDHHASQGDFVKISVEDEGVGISADRLGEIFKEFFTTKKDGKGTGLGLSVCHGIVREHGGWIDVRSALDQGSCFSVYLPQKEES